METGVNGKRAEQECKSPGMKRFVVASASRWHPFVVDNSPEVITGTCKNMHNPRSNK